VDLDKILADTKSKLELVKTHFSQELKKVRTGRANPAILDGVVVEAYNTPMPLRQVANITAPEAQLLQVTPFDPNNISAIGEAIRSNQSLGLNPTDDGRVVRIPIPPLTTERRQQLVKQLHDKFEESMISARNVRHENLSILKTAKNEGRIGEDDFKRIEKQIDELMQQLKTNIDAQMTDKEKEIMTV
jgi:ribosome recycling factor